MENMLPVDDIRRISVKTTTVSSLISIALGLLVLIGWYTHNFALVQVHPSFVPMQYNTALGFLLGGIGLLLLNVNQPALATLFGAGATSVGGLTLVEYLFVIDLGIDQLFMEHYITVKTSHPGRMAPNTALCFTLTGIGITGKWLLSKHKRHQHFIGIIGALVFSLGIVALSGYPFDMETTYGWGKLTRMALHTAAGFVILGIGLISYAWSIDTENETALPNWFSSLAGIAVATISITLWQAYYAHEVGTGNPIEDFSPSHAHDALLIFGFALAGVTALTIHYFQVIQTRNMRLEKNLAIREKLEEELLYREQQLHVITDNSPAHIAYVSIDSLRYLYVNKRFEVSFNKPRDQIVGKHIKEIIGHDNYQFALPYIEIVRSGQATSYENTFHTNNGKGWYHVNYVPDFAKDGSVRSYSQIWCMSIL